MSSTQTSGSGLSQSLLDVLIRAALIAALVIFCFRIFHPFLNLMVWALILAVVLYPMHQSLKDRLNSSDGRIATLLVVGATALLIVPIYLLGVSLTESAHSAVVAVRSGTLHVPPPPESVADWPLVGERLYGAWLQAASDMTGLAQKFAPQIKEGSLAALGKLASVGLGFLLLIAALIVAGILMAYGEMARGSAVEIASRIFGPGKGPSVIALCAATTRAVAKGVIGIAFIQMLLVGAGFILKGVPGAGLLTLGVLLLGIVQIPVSLITIPVIVYVFATEGANVATIVFTVFVFAAGLVDNVLKPLMLGRGVNVPMPVVLIGALGGMVANGVVGLFIGPVVLAVAYQLFWQWVRATPVTDQTTSSHAGEHPLA